MVRAKIEEWKAAQELKDKEEENYSYFDLNKYLSNHPVEIEDEDTEHFDFDTFVEQINAEYEEQQRTNRLKEIDGKPIHNKDDIMALFQCESDKALRFMKLLKQMGYSLKIGKEYYIKKDELKRFLDDYKGKDIMI